MGRIYSNVDVQITTLRNVNAVHLFGEETLVVENILKN